MATEEKRKEKSETRSPGNNDHSIATLICMLITVFGTTVAIVFSGFYVGHSIQQATKQLATSIGERPPVVVTVVVKSPLAPPAVRVTPTAGAESAVPEQTQPSSNRETPETGRTTTSGKPLHTFVEDPFKGLKVEAKTLVTGPDYTQLQLHIRLKAPVEPFFYSPFLRDDSGQKYEVDSDSLDKAHFALLDSEADVILVFHPAAPKAANLTLVLNDQSTVSDRVAPRMELTLR